MTTEEAALHWEALADDQEVRRDIAVGAGWGHPTPYNNRIRMYRGTAAAIRLMEETGESHCICHLVPSMKCPARARKGRPR